MSPRKPYEDTSVTVAKSQEELRGLLQRFGAKQFSMGEGEDWVGVEFVHENTIVRLRCPVREVSEAEYRKRATEQHKAVATLMAGGEEKERARVWRVLVWSTKARLVAVEEGLESFAQAFLAHIVDPASYRTLWQGMEDLVDSGAFQVGGTGMKALGR